MSESVPQLLDWVKERAACTLQAVFHKLCTEIESDVEQVNATRNLGPDHAFRYDYKSNGELVVGRTVGYQRQTVAFAVIGNALVYLSEPERRTASFTLSLNKFGRCILRRASDGEELETWQFRNEALEPLFFGG